MKKAEIFETIEDAAGLPRGTVMGGEELLALGSWDSLSGSEFRLMVNDRWGISLSGLALEKCTTVGDLLALVKEQLED